ncbi:MAG TPA: site-specific integrase [Nitrososphaeraceae archaeon]|nr:site-specific integrase [Nitrososphaeraceae archaeon]
MLVQEEDVYSNFINSIKSDVTKKVYEYNLRLFMEFCGIDRYEDLIGLHNQIIPYLISVRDKKLSYNSISTRLSAIYHFYDMNDIILNKKKIKMFKGEYTRKVVDRAYTHDEISRILNVSDLRLKSMILLMATAGLRIGAIPDLRLSNLQKINSVYRILAYPGANEEYFTFCTPECTSYIDAYLEFRTKNGEDLNKDSYLIRDQFDITDLEQIRNKSKRMSISGIESLVRVVLLKSGIRDVKHTPNYTRQIVAQAHGFRKFFTTQLVNSKVNPEIREMLLGHKIGLTGCYYRPTEQDMLNEYLKAVNLLTINEENRLKLKLEQTIQIEKTQLETLKSDFEKFKQEVLKQRSKR